MYLHLLPVYSLFVPVFIVCLIAAVGGIVLISLPTRIRGLVAGIALLVGAIVGAFGTASLAFGTNRVHNQQDLQTQAYATYGVRLTPGDTNFLLAGYSTLITISSTRNGNTVTDRNQLAKLGHQGDRTTLIISGPVSRDVHPVDENAHELPR